MERHILIASEGMVYTDGTIFGRKIYLQHGRNPDEFYEITNEEYNRIIEEKSSNEDE